VLSLLIVSIGVLRLELINRQSLNLALVGLVIIGSLHLVVSNLSYVYKSVTRYESPLAARLSKLSRVTIILVTVGFTGTFFHAVSPPTAEFLRVVLSPVVDFPARYTLFGFPTWSGLIDFGVPLLVVCYMSVKLFGWLRNTLGFSRDISIRTSPDTLHVYDDFDETEPVLVEIDNDGETGYEFDVHITPPPGTYLKVGDETEEEKFTLTEEVAAGRRWSENVELQHLGDADPGLLKIEIRHSSGIYSQEIRCLPR
jgi:hypothetical protein